MAWEFLNNATMHRQVITFLAFSGAALFAADFPSPLNTEKDKAAVPMPAEQAAAKFKVPPGFKVSVFASEPDVQNPIACCWDPQGRLWVAENYTYEAYRFNLVLRDRIVIFKDNGISKKPVRKVFCDTLQCLTSIEVGLGGVWAMCPPRLLFIPMKDDQPSGPAEVVLDGFIVPKDNYHNFANGLKWGPDGWLYGRCGASAPGEIGPPGTADAQRIPLRGGIWRYHPKRKVVEVLCHGTTNPWGHDWDERGECFFTNTVNGHLWHMIPGAHCTRPHTIDPNPYVYKLIDQHADHYHWDTSKPWSDSREAKGEHDKRGGGHAHCGAMIYFGEQWPKEYRGKLFTINLHGRRLNVERLERHGSGFVGQHEPDMLFAADPFFRGIDLTYGPDGSVYILDWSDTGECHEHTGVHRTSGRIYRVTYGEPAPKVFRELKTLSANDLIELQFTDNEWTARQARAALRDLRMEESPKICDVIRRRDAHKPFDRYELQNPKLNAPQKNELHRLRAMWTATALEFSANQFRMNEDHEASLCYYVRNLTDSFEIDTIYGRDSVGVVHVVNQAIIRELCELGLRTNSHLLRLTLGSTIQRLPVPQRSALAEVLVIRAEDAHDHNLPLLVWYGLIPVAESHPDHLVKVAAACEWPITRQCIARRLAEDVEKRPGPLNDLLKVTLEKPREYGIDILIGMSQGLRGWRKAPKPQMWDAVVEKLADLQLVSELSVVFGDGRALDDVRRIALDDKQPLEIRRSAVQTLIDARPADLPTIIEPLLKVQFLNTTAVKGMALSDDPAAAAKLIESYKKFHPSERGLVMDVLVSRPQFAGSLLDAIEKKKIAKTDLSAIQARQIASFHDDRLNERLAAVWGQARLTTDDKRSLMDRWRNTLTRQRISQGNIDNGKVVFERSCASCHKLHGQGGAIGPDLTGAQRDNLDYLLENIIDPSAVLSADYRVTRVELKDGRVFNGIVTTRTDQAITLQMEKEKLTIRRSDIENETPSTQSLMADGLLTNLSEKEVVDLFRYLMSF
jgi:putative membrane-bound dehydrogenase-like protein